VELSGAWRVEGGREGERERMGERARERRVSEGWKDGVVF